MRRYLPALGIVTFGVGLGGILVQQGERPDVMRAELPAMARPLPMAVRTAPAPGGPAAPPAELARARSEAPAARVESAVSVLASHVREQSHPDALRTAFQAYFNYKAAHPDEVRKPYLYFVDYGLDNRTPRGYVFDMDRLTLVDGPFTVAHGRGSSSTREGRPTRFSNKQGSNATSLGLFLAQETYGFSGKSAGRYYRSVGLRLRGLSGGYNSAARERGVVVHGAPYVTASQAGRSEGCPAMEQERAQKLLPKLSRGGLVFLFSPLHEEWMRKDPWAHAGPRSTIAG